MGKKEDLRDVEQEMAVGASLNISETDLQVFSLEFKKHPVNSS